MNRKEIKELAKTKIKGNLWNLLWPILAIGGITLVLTWILAPSMITTTSLLEYTEYTLPKLSPLHSTIFTLISLACEIITVGYKKYVLNFVRTGKCEFNDIIECFKTKWLNILISTILIGIATALGFALLVIPGIILTFMFVMTPYIVVDTDLDGVESMKESYRIMKGYKIDYFIFVLSFIGWGFLAGFTFGLLLIWLLPYIVVADALYYDKLKDIQKEKKN